MTSILKLAQIVWVNLFPGRKDLPGKADRNGAVGRDGGLGRPGWGTSGPGRDPGTSGCPHQSVADSLFGEGGLEKVLNAALPGKSFKPQGHPLLLAPPGAL